MAKKEVIPPQKNDLPPKFVLDSTMQKGNIPYDALESFPAN